MTTKSNPAKLKHIIAGAAVVIFALLAVGFSATGTNLFPENPPPDEMTVQAYETYRRIFDQINRMKDPRPALDGRAVYDVSFITARKSWRRPDLNAEGRAVMAIDGHHAHIENFVVSAVTVFGNEQTRVVEESFAIKDGLVTMQSERFDWFGFDKWCLAEKPYNLTVPLHSFWWTYGNVRLPDISVCDISSVEIEQRGDETVITMILDGSRQSLLGHAVGYTFHAIQRESRVYHLEDIHMTIVTDSCGNPVELSFEVHLSRAYEGYEHITTMLTFNAVGTHS